MDQWEQYAQAIRGANGLDSGNMYQNYANAGVIDASGAQFVGKQKAIQADNEETARRESAAIAEAEAKRKAQYDADAKDGSKAYMKLDENGHYRFYDGVGKGININQFSLLTGKRPDEILADSENPADQKFVQDYNTMRTFASAWVNGDNDTLKRLRASDPDTYQKLVSSYKTPGEMVKAFRNYYSDYYGDSTDKNTTTADRFTSPTLNPKFDFKPDKADTRGQAVAGAMSAAGLESTMNPNVPQKPVANNWFETVAPFSQFIPGTYRNQLAQYEEEKKKNPWLAYNSYLRGE